MHDQHENAHPKGVKVSLVARGSHKRPWTTTLRGPPPRSSSAGSGSAEAPPSSAGTRLPPLCARYGPASTRFHFFLSLVSRQRNCSSLTAQRRAARSSLASTPANCYPGLAVPFRDRTRGSVRPSHDPTCPILVLTYLAWPPRGKLASWQLERYHSGREGRQGVNGHGETTDTGSAGAVSAVWSR